MRIDRRLALAACETGPRMTAVAAGDAVVKERLVVSVTSPWNQFDRGPNDKWPMWTHEGLAIDALTFMVGVKDGELIAPTPEQPAGQRPLAFRATMQPAEVIELLQTAWTRDGSVFRLERVTPQEFVGVPGFRADYTFVRKADDARMQGVIYGAVRQGELFLIDFMAPRLGFFARYERGVEDLARSARVKG